MGLYCMMLIHNFWTKPLQQPTWDLLSAFELIFINAAAHRLSASGIIPVNCMVINQHHSQSRLTCIRRQEWRMPWVMLTNQTVFGTIVVSCDKKPFCSNSIIPSKFVCQRVNTDLVCLCLLSVSYYIHYYVIITSTSTFFLGGGNFTQAI